MKKGEKYIIEISEVHTHVDDNGKKFPLARIKGFSSLVFDQKGLDRLEKVVELKDCEPKNNEPKRTIPLLNCKFVVTKTTGLSFKVGKVYEVKDGKFSINGNDFKLYPMFRPLHSFDDLKDYLDERAGAISYFGGTTEILEIKE